ncbi:jg16432 [Pararge aegeria aegeria]|uniref:Jg16432 protein n=1 Tax=Pararge aegeria aegeria TaxID=348720 RepID=A0A8S4SJF5_9NEOP|nr:jg16432 [Pararge aegeria aegeria]
MRAHTVTKNRHRWSETVSCMATDAAPRWITPASRAHSRSLAGRLGRRVLHGLLLRSQGVLRSSATPLHWSITCIG